MAESQTKEKHRSHTPDYKMLVSLVCSWSNEMAKQALKLIVYAQTIPAIHPPRLSGFNREAQPWRVFCACRIWSGQHA